MRGGIFRFIVMMTVMISVTGQLASKFKPEFNPPFDIQNCTKTTGCQKVPGSITLDADMRNLKGPDGKLDCYKRNVWNPTLCPDSVTCAKNCALSGGNYHKARVSTDGNAINMKLFTKNPVNYDGSRIYLLDQEKNYQMFNLLNREFSFDVDVSKCSCGVNSALYFSAMKFDGGKSATNLAGSQLGTGYCDAQGPRNLRFVEGKANMQRPGGGLGDVGLACAEVDLWEASSISQAFTPHNCKNVDSALCRGEECARMCDRAGCGFASYRMGSPDFYGPSKTVDTTKVFTVITQFITSDGSDDGDLVEIRRVYIQNGRVIQNAPVNIPKVPPFTSTSDQFCDTIQSVFGGSGDFNKFGGMKSMGDSMRRGMVLVMSIWADSHDGMAWLDGDGSDQKGPPKLGSVRGSCKPGAGLPQNIKKMNPDAGVVFSSIKFGPIGSTFNSV